MKTKYKGIEVPDEIRADEAHLIHLLSIKSTPNTQTMEFENTAHVIKLNEQAFEIAKSQLPRFGLVFVIHDGRQHIQETEAEKDTADTDAEDKVLEAEKAKQEAEKLIKANEEKEAIIKEQAAKIAKYEQAEKDAAEAAKAENADKKTDEPIEEKQEVKSKANGKG